MPSLGYHPMPIDIPSTALVDPSFPRPITTALIQNLPGYSYSSSPSPNGLNTFSGGLATSPGVTARASTTEAMDVRQGQYNVNHSGSLVYRPDLRADWRSNREPRIDDRRFTCHCGKSFSGEWEKARHIKAVHDPPTIGCRVCHYKQSRKDLFSEHCRKRHPGESIEELMVQLDYNRNFP